MNRRRIQPKVAVELETVSLRLPALLGRAEERYAKCLGSTTDLTYVTTQTIEIALREEAELQKTLSARPPAPAPPTRPGAAAVPTQLQNAGARAGETRPEGVVPSCACIHGPRLCHSRQAHSLNSSLGAFGMRLDPHLARTTHYCKLKRVYPRLPLRVHSAVAKGFTGRSSGNPFRTEPTAGDAVRDLEWSADRLRIRLESEPSSEAWRGLESPARRRGRSVEQFLLGALGEAS